MFRIDSNGIIKLSRGDSCHFTVFLNNGTKQRPVRYAFHDLDKLYFYIVPMNKPFEQFFLERVFTKDDLNEHGDIEIRLNHRDTIDLPEGQYRYVLRLKKTRLEDELNDYTYEWNTVRNYTPFYLLGIGD